MVDHGADSDIGNTLSEFTLLDSVKDPLHNYDIIVSAFAAANGPAPEGANHSTLYQLGIQKFVQFMDVLCSWTQAVWDANCHPTLAVRCCVSYGEQRKERMIPRRKPGTFRHKEPS